MGNLFRYLITHSSKAVLLATIWTAFILLACFIPGTTLPKVAVPLIDKWVHFIIFAGFTYLWYFRFKKPNLKSSLILIILATGLGYLVEIIQGSDWVSNRSYEVNDVIADSIGGILGVILFIISYKIYKYQ